MAMGLRELEQMVKAGKSLNEITIQYLERSVEHYRQKVRDAAEKADDRERRVRAVKAASKGNE